MIQAGIYYGGHYDSCVCWATSAVDPINSPHCSYLNVSSLLRPSPHGLCFSLFSDSKVTAHLCDSWLPRGIQRKLPGHTKLCCFIGQSSQMVYSRSRVEEIGSPLGDVVGRSQYRRTYWMGTIIEDVSFGLMNFLLGAGVHETFDQETQLLPGK